uniref:Major capsid protein L1 n=1 Tax=Human papillomavirus TaxID=10566 RepID=H2BQC7_9PAPI|nr:L1 protein [Human papillomavirus]
MATWTPSTGRLYLPPAQPVARVLETDEYIIPTDLYFHANTERLLTVGHPFFDVLDSDDTTIQVPKVSGNQFRALRLKLPDPNKLALIDASIYNPDKERLVWRLCGIEIARGGPLGVGTTGHPLFDKVLDTENPSGYVPPADTDNRVDLSFDPKQNQVFIVGCRPAIGKHWDVAEPCKDAAPSPGSCPPVKLVHTMIEDGDMSDIGLGNVNFTTFSQSRSDAPLEVIDSICKWPDFVQMTKDVYGDSAFFYGRREQLYNRHMPVKDGFDGDSIPATPALAFYLPPAQGTPQKTSLGNISYSSIPSGSLVSSEASIFNRPYWLHKAQGKNNGIAWGNNLFVTFLDNTHNTNFVLSVYTETSTPLGATSTYNRKQFRKYLRHAEEVEIEIVMQLCKVPLNADVLAHLNAMNSRILDEWQLAFVPAPPQGLEDTYRYLKSLATICPTDAPSTAKPDPYEGKIFWEVDLTSKFSTELDQTPLGRKFLYQMGLLNGRKRPRSAYSSSYANEKPVRKTVKRRKLNK